MESTTFGNRLVVYVTVLLISLVNWCFVVCTEGKSMQTSPLADINVSSTGPVTHSAQMVGATC